MRLLRNIAILLAGALVLLYFAAFALLVGWQRDLLFIGTQYGAAPLARGYTAHIVREHDGTALTVWAMAPKRAGAPTVVFFYGNGGRLYHFAQVGRVLNADGYGILLASYRGYSGNAGRPSESGLMDDARAILSGMPAAKTILWGQSLGTGVAARMASEGRGFLLILQSPYTAVVDVAAMRFPIYPVRMAMWDRFDTLSIVDKIEVPVLILHGTADRTVPFAMGGILASRLGARATLVPIAHGTHDLLPSELLPPARAWLARLGGMR
ncbi:MAG TPA: alpha/beta hydrolase [Rhizomicrobium sp.]|nr:alpha/beta hydrolase [Rhizomicrobium sp.]